MLFNIIKQLSDFSCVCVVHVIEYSADGIISLVRIFSII